MSKYFLGYYTNIDRSSNSILLYVDSVNLSHPLLKFINKRIY